MMIVSTRTATNNLRYAKYSGVALVLVLSACHRAGVRVVKSGMTRKGNCWIIWDVNSASHAPEFVSMN